MLGASAWVNNGRWGIVMWEADQDRSYGTLKSLGRAHQGRQAGLVYYGGLAKGNAPGTKVVRTFVRDMTNGLLQDQTDMIGASATPKAEVDAQIHKELLAKQKANPRFSFTAGGTALWEVFGPVIRKLQLPISKDGKRGGTSVKDVFDRLVDAGLIRETEERGRTLRYEPVEATV